MMENFSPNSFSEWKKTTLLYIENTERLGLFFNSVFYRFFECQTADLYLNKNNTFYQISSLPSGETYATPDPAILSELKTKDPKIRHIGQLLYIPLVYLHETIGVVVLHHLKQKPAEPDWHQMKDITDFMALALYKSVLLRSFIASGKHETHNKENTQIVAQEELVASYEELHAIAASLQETNDELLKQKARAEENEKTLQKAYDELKEAKK